MKFGMVVCFSLPWLQLITIKFWFLADRTNGRAIATLLRLSSDVCL